MTDITMIMNENQIAQPPAEVPSHLELALRVMDYLAETEAPLKVRLAMGDVITHVGKLRSSPTVFLVGESDVPPFIQRLKAARAEAGC